MKQIPLAIGIDAEPDFDNFVTGDNGVVVQALLALVSPSPPMYLYGPVGAGKTHLLAALVRSVRQQGGRCGWFHADDPLPWTFEEGWSLIVIDAAERLDAAHQHAAFTLFVEAATHGVQMVSAGRLPPVDLPVREDLRTRFGWGPVFALQPLDVMDYLLTRFSRDLASLMALLRQLDKFSLAERRAVTVPLLKKMVAEEGQTA